MGWSVPERPVPRTWFPRRRRGYCERVTLVLLAVDETPASAHAARIARDLFGDDARYLAVSVTEQAVPWFPMPMSWGGVYPYWPPNTAIGIDTGEGAEEVEQRARAVAGEVAADAGVSATTVGAFGDPVDAIARTAEEHAVDVIVVGSNDKGWWRRLLEGSVSTDLVRHAGRPVLVVHTDEADEDTDRGATRD